jgi:hypothetical protein
MFTVFLKSLTMVESAAWLTLDNVKKPHLLAAYLTPSALRMGNT